MNSADLYIRRQAMLQHKQQEGQSGIPLLARRAVLYSREYQYRSIYLPGPDKSEALPMHPAAIRKPK